jgi:hypothetical protein
MAHRPCQMWAVKSVCDVILGLHSNGSMRKLCTTGANCYRLRLISKVAVDWVAIFWFNPRANSLWVGPLLRVVPPSGSKNFLGLDATNPERFGLSQQISQ